MIIVIKHYKLYIIQQWWNDNINYIYFLNPQTPHEDGHDLGLINQFHQRNNAAKCRTVEPL